MRVAFHVASAAICTPVGELNFFFKNVHFEVLIAWLSSGQTRMRVEKREFAWEFSQLSCPAVKREQELYESWWELRSESLHERFLNSPAVKREQELHESWWELTGYYKLEWELVRVEKREFAWEFSQLSCLGQTRTRVVWESMRVDWILTRQRKLLSTLKKFEHVQSPCMTEALAGI
jgi:hypothetical protein